MKTRNWASLAAGLAVVGALTACAPHGTPMTQYAYDASDGVRVSVGDVSLLNLIVFTEDGEDGNLTGTITNRGDDDVELTLQYESDGDKAEVVLEVAARETVQIGSGEFGQVFLAAIDRAPGTLLKLYFQYGTAPGKQAEVPVLDNRLIPQYADLLPTPTPTPTPTETLLPTPDPTETPAP